MKSIYLIAILYLMVFAFASCSKEETGASETLSDETLGLVSESTTSEMLDASINSSINEAIAYTEKSVSEQKSATISDCMDISIKPIFGYPKTITVDYGERCISENGITRSGSIAITISDTLRTTGTTYTVAFDNFSIEGYSVSGEISVQNTSTEDIPSFYQEMDLTMTGTNGLVIQKTKTSDRAWIEGSNTDDITDDVFSVSGSADVNSSEGGYYSYDITEPLKISYSCDFISEGVMQLTTSENNAPITIDFGNSVCDLIVYISQGTILNKEVDLGN